MTKFRVWMHTKPGFEPYDGYVDVYAETRAKAFGAAVRALQRSTFPGRGIDCWTLDSVEVLS